MRDVLAIVLAVLGVFIILAVALPLDVALKTLLVLVGVGFIVDAILHSGRV